MHTHEQYDLSVHNGAIHWIHRNEYDQQIFSVHTEPIVVKGITQQTKGEFPIITKSIYKSEI